MKQKKIALILFLAFALLAIWACSATEDITGSNETPETPVYIDDLTTGLPNYNSIILSWTAPEGALEYDIRYSSSAIDTSNWDSAEQVDDEPTPQDEGEIEIYRLEGLTDTTEYYIAMKFRTDATTWSGLSNVAICYTAPFDSRNKIVFHSYVDDNYELFMIDSDGSNLRRLTDNYSTDGNPVWTYDGRSIVFYSCRDGNFQIYMLDIVAETETNISDNSYSEVHPHCSFAGAVMALRTDAYGSTENIMTMNLDGTNRTVRTFYDSDTAANAPKFSADGTKIAFYADFGSSGFGICTMDADGSDFVRLTDGTFSAGSPDWSPDGTKILYESSWEGNNEIYVMDADGNNHVNLTNNSAFDGSASWSPDGTKIAFASSRDGADYEIYIMDADGSNVVQITDNDYDDNRPSWSPLY